MEVFSRPGSLKVYSSSPRSGLPPPNDCPPSIRPASYVDYVSGIAARSETVAPFDTSAIRGGYRPNGLPGPAEYYPDRRPLREYGTLTFAEGMHCSEDSQGPIYKPMDGLDKMIHDAEMQLTTMRPRVQPEKFVSNNIPTVFNPRDVRQFVEGLDGRMYPWWNKECQLDSPGPKYDVSNCHTCRAVQIDFGSSRTRREVFKPTRGFGPADFNTRQPLASNGGLFLSKTSNPQSSIPRMFDLLVCQDHRGPSASPASFFPKSDFDRFAGPKRKGIDRQTDYEERFKTEEDTGPGPSTYFQEQKRMQDIQPLIIGYRFSKAAKRAPFNNSEERIRGRDGDSLPGPGVYNIYGFTDMIQYNLCRHRLAFINPKLGFLVSAEARSNAVFQAFEMEFSTRPPTVPGKWRNLRPKPIRTCVFHGSPQYAGTPGPNAYDTRSAYKFLKNKKSWWNPRDYTGTGFGNSGCDRRLKIADIDYDNPGPKYAVRSEFPGPGGYVNRTGARFQHNKTDSPGPRHKPHEKCDSIWRATHLGIPNVFLKRIDRVTPTAGGYHPRGPLDALADRQRDFCRVDDYAEELNPGAAMKGLKNVEHHHEDETQQHVQDFGHEEIPGEGEAEEEEEFERPPAEVKAEPAPAPAPATVLMHDGEMEGEDAQIAEADE